jgi:DoxX-like family
MLWGGRIATAIAVLILIGSAVMKVMFVMNPSKEMADGMAHLGWATNMVLTLAILEISCVVLYLIPRTAVIGAILLTGYLGGAVATHLRVGDPVFGPLVPAVLAWAGLYCRDPRIRALIPLRG